VTRHRRQPGTEIGNTAISPATMPASTRSMRSRGGLWSQPSIRERRIRFIAALLCAVCGVYPIRATGILFSG
jgi:hypothetical protein